MTIPEGVQQGGETEQFQQFHEQCMNSVRAEIADLTSILDAEPEKDGETRDQALLAGGVIESVAVYATQHDLPEDVAMATVQLGERLPESKSRYKVQAYYVGMRANDAASANKLRELLVAERDEQGATPPAELTYRTDLIPRGLYTVLELQRQAGGTIEDWIEEYAASPDVKAACVLNYVGAEAQRDAESPVDTPRSEAVEQILRASMDTIENPAPGLAAIEVYALRFVYDADLIKEAAERYMRVVSAVPDNSRKFIDLHWAGEAMLKPGVQADTETLNRITEAMEDCAATLEDKGPHSINSILSRWKIAMHLREGATPEYIMSRIGNGRNTIHLDTLEAATIYQDYHVMLTHLAGEAVMRGDFAASGEFCKAIASTQSREDDLLFAVTQARTEEDLAALNLGETHLAENPREQWLTEVGGAMVRKDVPAMLGYVNELGAAILAHNPEENLDNLIAYTSNYLLRRLKRVDKDAALQAAKTLANAYRLGNPGHTCHDEASDFLISEGDYEEASYRLRWLHEIEEDYLPESLRRLHIQGLLANAAKRSAQNGTPPAGDTPSAA
jgi:hypothetical protein